MNLVSSIDYLVRLFLFSHLLCWGLVLCCPSRINKASLLILCMKPEQSSKRRNISSILGFGSLGFGREHKIFVFADHGSRQRRDRGAFASIEPETCPSMIAVILGHTNTQTIGCPIESFTLPNMSNCLTTLSRRYIHAYIHTLLHTYRLYSTSDPHRA